eukprot:s2692_g15.t1
MRSDEVVFATLLGPILACAYQEEAMIHAGDAANSLLWVLASAQTLGNLLLPPLAVTPLAVATCAGLGLSFWPSVAFLVVQQLGHWRAKHSSYAHCFSLAEIMFWRGTWRHPLGTQLALVTRLVPGGAASLCMASVAFGDIGFHFVWQAWQLATWTFTLCGKGGTYGTQLALVTRLVPGGAASLCVAGVAFGDIDLHFVWQAWHLATWTSLLCGRRGTQGTGVKAGVAGATAGTAEWTAE